MNRLRVPPATASAAGDVRIILDSLRHIVRVLRIASRAAEKRVGLSAAQLFALNKLAEGGAGSLGELAGRTFTHQSSVSVVVQRLVERDLVRRQASRVDGRRVELVLTAAGRALLRRAPQAAQDQLIAGLQRLSSAERRRLARTLARLVRALGGTERAPTMFFEENGEPEHG
jgi:DNA-binding MarR family transcriptional regulator